MGERNQTQNHTEDTFTEDLYDPALNELMDEDFVEVEATASNRDKQTSLAVKRRRAEQRLEALRLREELGDYDFDFDDY